MKHLFILISLLASFAFAQTAVDVQGVVVYTPTQQMLYSLPDDALVAIFKLSLLLVTGLLVYSGFARVISAAKHNRLREIHRTAPTSTQLQTDLKSGLDKFYFKNWFAIALTLLFTIPAYFVLKFLIIFLFDLLIAAVGFL